MALGAGNNDKLSILKHAMAGDEAALARVIPDDDGENPETETLVATVSVTAPQFIIPEPATVTDLATLITALEAAGLVIDGT